MREINERATEEYWEKRWIDWRAKYFTPDHPHRQQTIDVLKECKFDSVLEVGCGAGANLYRIKQERPEVKVYGLDINKDAIIEAQKNLPDGVFKKGMAERLPFEDKSVDLLLTDACMIYVPPEAIEGTVNELVRVARKYIVCCEWMADEAQYDNYWVYNYRKLFKKYNVGFTKIEGWPGGWERYGNIAKVEVKN
jgi:ubiquinone/menaquinone biosynthesis C-methylase UbiE